MSPLYLLLAGVPRAASASPEPGVRCEAGDAAACGEAALHWRTQEAALDVERLRGTLVDPSVLQAVTASADRSLALACTAGLKEACPSAPLAPVWRLPADEGELIELPGGIPAILGVLGLRYVDADGPHAVPFAGEAPDVIRAEGTRDQLIAVLGDLGGLKSDDPLPVLTVGAAGARIGSLVPPAGTRWTAVTDIDEDGRVLGDVQPCAWGAGACPAIGRVDAGPATRLDRVGLRANGDPGAAALTGDTVGVTWGTSVLRAVVTGEKLGAIESRDLGVETRGVRVGSDGALAIGSSTGVWTWAPGGEPVLRVRAAGDPIAWNTDDTLWMRADDPHDDEGSSAAHLGPLGELMAIVSHGGRYDALSPAFSTLQTPPVFGPTWVGTASLPTGPAWLRSVASLPVPPKPEPAAPGLGEVSGSVSDGYGDTVDLTLVDSAGRRTPIVVDDGAWAVSGIPSGPASIEVRWTGRVGRDEQTDPPVQAGWVLPIGVPAEGVSVREPVRTWCDIPVQAEQGSATGAFATVRPLERAEAPPVNSGWLYGSGPQDVLPLPLNPVDANGMLQIYLDRSHGAPVELALHLPDGQSGSVLIRKDFECPGALKLSTTAISRVRILDASGGPVADTRVTIVDEATRIGERAAYTDAAGELTFRPIAPAELALVGTSDMGASSWSWRADADAIEREGDTVIIRVPARVHPGLSGMRPAPEAVQPRGERPVVPDDITASVGDPLPFQVRSAPKGLEVVTVRHGFTWMKPGDIVLAVGGQPVVGWSAERFDAWLQAGLAVIPVSATVLRQGWSLDVKGRGSRRESFLPGCTSVDRFAFMYSEWSELDAMGWGSATACPGSPGAVRTTAPEPGVSLEQLSGRWKEQDPRAERLRAALEATPAALASGGPSTPGWWAAIPDPLVQLDTLDLISPQPVSHGDYFTMDGVAPVAELRALLDAAPIRKVTIERSPDGFLVRIGSSAPQALQSRIDHLETTGALSGWGLYPVDQRTMLAVDPRGERHVFVRREGD